MDTRSVFQRGGLLRVSFVLSWCLLAGTAFAAPPARAAARAAPPTSVESSEPTESEPEQSRHFNDSTSDARKRARELYEQAAKAYAEKKNFEAIELFEQAARVAYSPLYFYNIGLAYEDAGDVRHALSSYRRYLRLAPAADDRAEVAERIENLEQRLAGLGVQQLTILSEPAGATLFIDGEAVGVTPYTAEFPPGDHAVRLQLRGHIDASASVILPQDRSFELTLKLQPEPPPAPEKPMVVRVSPENTSKQSRGLSRVQPLSWALLGVGIGGLGGGLFFELSRAQSKARAETADDATEAAHARGAAEAKQLSSLALLGAGAAFTISGGVLFALDLSGSDTRPHRKRGHERARLDQSLRIACSPLFCGVAGAGRF